MMDDLKERLRQSAALPNGLYAEAADHIEALEAELIEQARSNGKGAEREAKLKAKLAVAREALKKIVADEGYIAERPNEYNKGWNDGRFRARKTARQALKELDND